MTDPRGKTTTKTYDEWNRLTVSEDPLGARTEFAYDGNGNQVRVIDPEGRSTTFGYDKRNRLTTETNNAGVVVATHLYDPAGNRTSTTDARTEVTEFTYDGLNRLTKTKRPDGGTTIAEYDGLGNVVAMVDPNGHPTTFTFNALRQLTAVRDAADGTWSYEIDPYGNMTKMTNPSEAVTEYTYDKLGRKIATKDAAGNIAVAQYDAVGNLLSIQEGTMAPRSYTYDLLNRLTSIQAAGIVTIQYAYDANGNRTSMIDGTGETFYTYDDASRLITKKVADGKQIAYTYNRAGQVATLTDYGGKVTAYTYDGVGRLQQATWDGQTATFGYDAGGNRTSITLPGGVSVSYTYDSNNRLTALVNRNGSGELSNYSYTYDKVGNRLSETTASGTTGYEYDLRNQLARVTAPGGAQTVYTYDEVGNRLSQSDASGQTTYTYDAANRLTQTATAGVTNNFTWDAAGNQLSDGKLSYSYDALNRLVGVTGAGKSISYVYDGDSLLWDRQENGAKSRFYLNGDRVINEGNGAGAITASMFQTASENLGRNAGSAAYMLYNGHGDLTGVTDGGGAQVAAYQYDAFGNLAGQSGSYATSFLYTGEYFDGGASLYYLRARFYSPGLGRFLTQDTYKGNPSEPWTQHLYAYVGNNPVNYIDPTGHAALSVGACGKVCLDGPAGYGQYGTGTVVPNPGNTVGAAITGAIMIAVGMPAGPTTVSTPAQPSEPTTVSTPSTGQTAPTTVSTPATNSSGPTTMSTPAASGNSPTTMSTPAADPSAPTTVFQQQLTYEPSPKHEGLKPWGTPNRLTLEQNQGLLNSSITGTSQSSNARFAVGPDGQFYKFLPTRLELGTYHGFPVPASSVPAEVRKHFFEQGMIDKGMLRGR